MLPNTIKDDVLGEAAILSHFSHPHLPFLFGIVTAQRPFKIITQFQGIDNESVTMGQEISLHKIGISASKTWVSFCVQLFEALHHLHSEHSILHNDIKSDNIIITEEASVPAYSILLIDFGKASTKANGCRFHLSKSEQRKHLVKYRHIAPEVVCGEVKQSEQSDVYSAGRIVELINDHGLLSSLQKKEIDGIKKIISMCKSHFTERPTVYSCMDTLLKITMAL